MGNKINPDALFDLAFISVNAVLVGIFSNHCGWGIVYFNSILILLPKRKSNG